MSNNQNTWQRAITRILGFGGIRMTWQKALAILADGLEDFSNGYFPGMGSGSSDTVMGGASASSSASSTLESADGVAQIQSVLGNTIVWNQLISFTSGTQASTDVTLTRDGTHNMVTFEGTAAEDRYFTLDLSNNIVFVNGHKYLATPYIGSNETIKFFITSANSPTGATLNFYATPIFTVTNPVEVESINIVVRANAISQGKYYVNAFDLTAMFGTGNEPSTVAEFEALYTEEYYDYDAGSLLSVNIQGIKTEDANGDTLDTLSIPAATYFPNGMRSAGTVCDELYADHADTVIGAVDLGTLTWERGSTSVTGEYRFITQSLKNVIQPSGDSAVGNIVCAKYESKTANNTFTQKDGVSVGSLGIVQIFDTAYKTSTVDTFTAAMSGVWLFYELATPTTTPIEPPLDFRYKVANGGTQEIVADGLTAYPEIIARYPQDVSMIVDDAASMIAPVENGKASTNYAIGSYLVNNGKLCKVTSAIASGEDVVQGTNCTATTVMAEVVALTS